MSPITPISQNLNNLATSEIGQKAIQGGKALLEATGTSAKLKRWAVDSLEKSYKRRHDTTIHGTNRQIWGSAATAGILSIGGTAAAIAGAACLPLGIAIGIGVGIGALASIAVTACGIRRSYKDNKKYNAGMDRCTFAKETIQNITAGALQACISKDKIDKWKLEKTQHQEKNKLLQALQNLPNHFHTTFTLSRENLKDLFTEKINPENIFTTLKNHLQINIQTLKNNPNQLDNAKSLVKSTLERQLKFFKKIPNSPVDIQKLEGAIKKIDNYDLKQITTALELCNKYYVKIEEAINNNNAEQTIKQGLTTVINNSIPQDLKKDIQRLQQNLQETTIALELIDTKGTEKFQEAKEKFSKLHEQSQNAVKEIISQVREKKQTIENLSNQVNLLEKTINDKTQSLKNALPTAEEFLKEEIQILKQDALNKAKEEIKNQLKPELEILKSIINNQYTFNIEDSEANETIKEVNNKLNDSLNTIKDTAQKYLNQIDEKIDNYFNISNFDFNKKNNLDTIQKQINNILTDAKNHLKELPKTIESQLRENAANIDIGNTIQSVKDFTKHHQITLSPYL